MTQTNDSEVVVVGAGPVGLVTALALARAGVRVQIFDEAWRTSGRSYALALHPGALGVLEELGLASELISRGNRIERIVFFSHAERTATLELDALGGPHPFILVLPQQALEDALESALAAEGVAVRWNHHIKELTDGPRGVALKIDRTSKQAGGYGVAASSWLVEKSFGLSADYVVGTDGYRSVVRRSLDIPFPEVAPPEVYAVFEYASGGSPTNEMRIVIDEEKTSVLWPLPDGRHRWSLQIDDAAFAEPRQKSRLAMQVHGESYPQLTRELLTSTLFARAPWYDAPVGSLAWSVEVRFERRLAPSFGSGRCYLAGDAAHMAAPIGVQSMNRGIVEARALADRLTHVLRQGSTPSELEAYATEQHERWEALRGLPETLNGPGASPWARGNVRRIVDALPASGAALETLCAALGLVRG